MLKMKGGARAAIAAGVLLAGVASVTLAAPSGPRACTEPVTGDAVVAGDAIRAAGGREFVCTDGTLVTVASYGQPVAWPPLPGWFDWTYATWATTREVCGKRAARRAIVVWAKNVYNDNSMVMCANGRFSELS